MGFTEVADRIWVARYEWFDVNVTLVGGSAGLLVVDTHASELAALVHKQAEGGLDVESRGVKQAGFYVLKWAQMPAVLVESAFITNPKEESLLRSPKYIDRLAKAVVRGVQEYEKRKTQARLGKGGNSGG